MTLIHQVNNLVSNGTQLVFAWKEFMKTASPSGPGWSIKSSSNGTTFGSGDNIASAATFGNSGWFVLDDPAHGREILIQRGTSDTLWWFSYSKAAGFTGGGATTRPTATDEAIILANGGGTSFTTWVATAHEAIAHFMANDSDGYGFYLTAYGRGDLVTTVGGFVMDEIESSSINIDGYTGDTAVFYIASANATSWTLTSLTRETTAFTSDRVVSWLYYSHASQSFTNTPALFYASGSAGASTLLPGQVLIDKSVSTTQHHLIFPMLFGRRLALGGTTGWKGIGKYLKWKGSALQTGATITASDSNQYIIVGDAALIWPANTVAFI